MGCYVRISKKQGMYLKVIAIVWVRSDGVSDHQISSRVEVMEMENSRHIFGGRTARVCWKIGWQRSEINKRINDDCTCFCLWIVVAFTEMRQAGKE